MLSSRTFVACRRSGRAHSWRAGRAIGVSDVFRYHRTLRNGVWWCDVAFLLVLEANLIQFLVRFGIGCYPRPHPAMKLYRGGEAGG
jgi:hypothetical protein